MTKQYPRAPGEHYYTHQSEPYDQQDLSRGDESAPPSYPPQAVSYYYENQQSVIDRRLNDRRAQPDEEYREQFLSNLLLNGSEQRAGFGRRQEDYDKWLH